MDTSELQASIDEAIRKASLSPDMFEKLQAELVVGRNAQRREDYILKENKKFDQINREQAEVITELKAKIHQLESDAKSVQEADTAKQVAEAKASTLSDCFGLVFRNAQVRKTVLDDVPVSMTHGDQNSTWTHVERHQQSTTTTEEQT